MNILTLPILSFYSRVYGKKDIFPEILALKKIAGIGQDELWGILSLADIMECTPEERDDVLIQYTSYIIAYLGFRFRPGFQFTVPLTGKTQVIFSIYENGSEGQTGIPDIKDVERVLPPSDKDIFPMTYKDVGDLYKRSRMFRKDFLETVGKASISALVQFEKHNLSNFEKFLLTRLVGIRVFQCGLAQALGSTATVEGLKGTEKTIFFSEVKLSGFAAEHKSSPTPEDLSKCDLVIIHENENDPRNDLVIGRINAARRGNEEIVAIIKRTTTEKENIVEYYLR